LGDCGAKPHVEWIAHHGFREASGEMPYKPIDADLLIEASAQLLHLKIAPEYRPGIKQNLKTASKMAALMEQVKLEDGEDPLPVYRP
jgi:hypothetical protein